MSWFEWMTPMDWLAAAVCVALAIYSAWTWLRLDALRWPDLDEPGTAGDEQRDAPPASPPWESR